MCKLSIFFRYCNYVLLILVWGIIFVDVSEVCEDCEDCVMNVDFNNNS